MTEARFKAGDRVVYKTRTVMGRYGEETRDQIYTLVTDPDLWDVACATWIDNQGRTHNSKITLKRGNYVHYKPRRDATMAQHLYRHPNHSVEVSNSGMPAEFIFAQCNDCEWEAQW